MSGRPCVLCGRRANPPTKVKRRRRKSVVVCPRCVDAAQATAANATVIVHHSDSYSHITPGPSTREVLQSMIDLKLRGHV